MTAFFWGDYYYSWALPLVFIFKISVWVILWNSITFARKRPKSTFHTFPTAKKPEGVTQYTSILNKSRLHSWCHLNFNLRAVGVVGVSKGECMKRKCNWKHDKNYLNANRRILLSALNEHGWKSNYGNDAIAAAQEFEHVMSYKSASVFKVSYTYLLFL